METGKPFLLSQESKIHKKAVRSICAVDAHTFVSAGLDGAVVIWCNDPQIRAEATEDSSLTAGSEWRPVRRLAPFGTQVYAVVSGPVWGAKGDAKEKECTFFVGGGDGKIAWVSAKTGATSKLFIGHTKVVSSLAYQQWDLANLLVSGSWDSTARVWDLDSGDCLGVLKGHSYAVSVSCCLSFRRPMIISASQDGAIRFWDAMRYRQQSRSDGSCRVDEVVEPVKVLSGYHTDVVRALVVEESLLWSCSNDGSIKVFDLEKNDVKSEVAGHSCFVYDLSVASYIWSAPDDGDVKVWSRFLNLLQTVPHGRTVWTVAALSNGDYVTGCEDGSLRVWTLETSRAAPLEIRRNQQESAKEARRSAQTSEVNIATLPDVAEIARTRGSRVGEHRLFRDNGTAVVFQWTGNVWDKIGDMIGGAGSPNTMGQYFEGDDLFPAGFYDYVFYVEIGDSGDRKELPYRVSDDKFLVAEKFCARERISKANVAEIVHFIESNSVRVETSVKAASPASQPPTETSVFPTEFLSFEKFNPATLKAKLLSLNEEMRDDELRLTPLELSCLDGLIEHISQTNWQAKDFKLSEIDLVFRSRLTKWPIEAQLPVLDLWRILALHQQSSELHKLSDGGWQFIASAFKAAQSVNAPVNVKICALRYVANSFLHPMTRSALLLYGTHVLRATKEVPPEPRLDNICGAILLNLALAIHHSSSTHVVLAEQVAETCLDFLQRVQSQPSRSTVLVALALSLKLLSIGSRAPFAGKVMLLSSESPDDAACLSELRRLCEI